MKIYLNTKEDKHLFYKIIFVLIVCVIIFIFALGLFITSAPSALNGTALKTIISSSSSRSGDYNFVISPN